MSNADTAIPLSVKHAIDRLCDQLERDFQRDASVRIEPYLARVDAQHRDYGLRELLALEFELRGFNDVAEFSDELHVRFAKDPTIISDVVNAISSDSSVPRPVLEKPGAMIGPYKLLEKIGEGGMGVVYIAEQRRPVRRRVALKIIKPGMDTKEVIARFEAERQALAMMDHAHIARVLDVGATETGRPYFVMEFVHGVPLTNYCDEQKLNTVSRLNLFKDVCHAIQHAHLKGIIHRDIKPNNILVSTADAKPVVKVIDFGVAKAIHQPLTDQTVYTRFTQLVGTPLYMSPEQAGSSSDIDTRTDIYSSGVLLYELLTGHTPFDRQRFHTAAFEEVQRIIREEEPCKPSTKISTLGDAASDVSDRRRSDPRKLRQTLQGDLDWIVMKAMDKDRTRRYETASALADDVQRFIDDEPVLASPPSAGYRLRKLVRRNRAVVLTGALIASALILGVIGTTAGLVRALKEKERADLAVIEEAKSKAEAEQRAKELEQVTAFQGMLLERVSPLRLGHQLRDTLLHELRETLSRSESDAAEVERQIQAIESRLSSANFTNVALESLQTSVIDPAINAIEEDFEGQPVMQARLLSSSGETLRKLGMLAAAAKPTQRALDLRRSELGDEHPETLSSMTRLGWLYYSQGELQKVEPLFRKSLEGRRKALGNDHRDTLGSINNMGSLLSSMGKFDEATEYFRESVAGSRRVLGDDSHNTLIAICDLGILLQEQGKLEEAERYLHEALSVARKSLGNDHSATVGFVGCMASLLEAKGDHENAERHYREALERSRRVLGDEHGATLASMVALGNSLLQLDRPSEAEPLFRECYNRRQQLLQADDWRTYTALSQIGEAVCQQQQFEAAESMLVTGFAKLKDSTAEEDVKRSALKRVVELYEEWHRAEPTAGHDEEAKRWKAKLAKSAAIAPTATE